MLKPPYQQHRFVLPILLTIPGILVSQAVAAQIIPDATLGSESSVALPVDAVTDRIEQGAIRGSALFHSFQEFNINEGHSAYFATPVGITNILSRVTGNDASDIFGTLGVEGTANLFFLNPNGIVFGPNAQLDVAGTAVFSTGDRFSFADGKWFSATEPNAPPLLTMNVTPGLQLGAGQAPITNNGQLSAGQDLTLYGSDLEVSGQLGAGANLSLLTDGAITVRDTPTEAFVA
ncbi:MAG: filamentous hemagglutinin N-terminal domain-containing protein, partial [Cyanobacteria bacterium P01_F01_bin.150]